MEREVLVKGLYKAAIVYAEEKGLDEAVVRFGGNITSWTFPVHVGLENLEEKMDEYTQNPEMLYLVLKDKNDPNHSLTLNCKRGDYPDMLDEMNIELRYEEKRPEGYDTSVNIVYSDAKRGSDDAVLHTEDYELVGTVAIGDSSNDILKHIIASCTKEMGEASKNMPEEEIER